MATMTQHPHTLPRLLVECAWFVRGSRSLASMLPALITSGLLALVITAVTLYSNGISSSSFGAAWLESWLVAWPIAFPIAYIARPRRKPARRQPGLALSDIDAASGRVTEVHGCKVLRGLRPAHPRHGCSL